MRVRGPERSSILLIGRSTVIIGAVVITVLSFGLGYFWGYKGSDVSQTEDEVKKDTEQKSPISPEDKRVLETTPKEAPIALSIKPPEFPQETRPQKSPETEKELPREQKTAEGKADKSHGVEIAEDMAEQIEKAQPAEKASLEAKESEAKRSKPAANAEKSAAKKKAVTKTSKTSGKLYTIQFGAFPNKEGAEQLRQSLSSKGIKAYIVSRTESDPYFRVRVGTYKSKKDAEKNAVILQKKTEMQNFVTTK